jgi:hypothetical protein
MKPDVRVWDDDWEETASVARGYSVRPVSRFAEAFPGSVSRLTRRLCHGDPSGESEKADQLTGDIQSALACRRRSTWIR